MTTSVCFGLMENSTQKRNMVNKCFIFGCRNYVKNQKCPTFGVPKDPDLLQKWAEALQPYSNGKTLLSRHRICQRHFMPDDLDKYYVYFIQGTEIRMEKDRPTLKKGAIPSVFPRPKKEDIKACKKNKKPNKKNSKKLIQNSKGVNSKGKNQVPSPLPTDLVQTIQFPVFVQELINVEDEEAFITKYQVADDKKLQASYSLPLKSPVQAVLSEEQVPPDKDVLPGEQEVLSEKVTTPQKHVPLDREVSAVCINWDALPLPEEIGSLLCDSGARASSTRADFNVKLPRKDLSVAHGLKSPSQLAHKAESSNSTESRSKEQLVPSSHESLLTESTTHNFSSTCDVAETLPDLPLKTDSQSIFPNDEESPALSAEQESCDTDDFTGDSSLEPSIQNSHKSQHSLQRRTDSTNTTNLVMDASRDDIEDTPLSFSEFKKTFTELKLPSSLWATHSDQKCICFSLLTFETHGFRAAPRIERIVMYEGNMRPRLFVRAAEVKVPSISETNSNSMLAVFKVLCQVQDLRLCLGTNRADGAFSFSADCDVVLESVKVPRCAACRKERELEYKKKRHLEYEGSRSAYRSSKKR